MAGPRAASEADLQHAAVVIIIIIDLTNPQRFRLGP
jgi:hypothetical protein